MTSTLGPEEAITAYLRIVAGGDPGLDTSELEGIIRHGDDPVQRLRAAAEYVQRTDPRLIEQRFIEVIHDWATEHEISPTALFKMGVSTEVLERAGFFGRASRRHKRAVRYNATELYAKLPDEAFTVADLQRLLGGGSAEKLRQLLNHLASVGKVRSLGTIRGPRGRPFTLWAKTATAAVIIAPVVASGVGPDVAKEAADSALALVLG